MIYLGKSTLLTVALLLAGSLSYATGKPGPKIEDYATIESIVNGVPVYSFSNIIYVYGVSPDLMPGMVMQEGNKNPAVKIKPKKSWEIKHNWCGSEHHMTPKTAWNDCQTLLPIHLIDGDPDTIWGSWGCAVPDGREEWIRIDLPFESNISSVALVCSKAFRQKAWGKSLPKELKVRVSRDAWHWDTAYETNDLSGDESGTTVIKFDPRPAKQVWVLANNLREEANYSRFVFSIGELEVRDAVGNNLALISRGAGVTVSSVGNSHDNDRFTQDALWGPLQFDLGLKWVRLGGDNGPYMWNYVEHQKGKLEIDKRVDESVTECVRNGMNVIINLDWTDGNWLYRNPPRKTDWLRSRFREFVNNYVDGAGFCNQSPEMFEGYLRYVDYMVRHFKGRVLYWEIGNEYDLCMTWSPTLTLDDSLDVFNATYQTIKKADPNARVMLGSFASFDPSSLLTILGPGSGVRDGKLAVRGRLTAITDGMKEKDVKVGLDAKSDAQVGIVLRFKNRWNFLLAAYDTKAKAIQFYEVVDDKWCPYGVLKDPPVQVTPAEGLGPDIHLIAEVSGAQVRVTLSDGKKTVVGNHAIKSQALMEGVGVGIYHNPLCVGERGGPAYHSGARSMLPALATIGTFDNIEIADASGHSLMKDDFSKTSGTGQPVGWRAYVGHWKKEGAARKVDAIGWHGDLEGIKVPFVKQFKKDCEGLGFKGQYLTTEIYHEAGYPPGPPASTTEIQFARGMAQDTTIHCALNIESGPCHPHFTGFPHPQSLCRWTLPNQTIVPCQPSMVYYTYRTISTVLDDFWGEEFPVTYSTNRPLESYTFRRGDGKELMIASWIPSNKPEGVDEVKTDITMVGIKAKRAWVIDLMNGTEQELIIASAGSDTLIPRMLVKDYPVFIRVAI